MKDKVRGYDTPQLYREDTLDRIKRLEREANDSARRMNELSRKETYRRIRLNCLIHFSLFVLVLMAFSASPSWSSHSVGEPELEAHPSWNRCCADQDCVPQQVRILGNERAGKISVKIEGVQTKVDKDKLHAVPSQRTWVCYFNLNGKISNDNVRCILYPEKSSTVNVPTPLTSLDGTA